MHLKVMALDCASDVNKYVMLMIIMNSLLYCWASVIIIHLK